MGPLELQERNVEVFDSGGIVHRWCIPFNDYFAPALHRRRVQGFGNLAVSDGVNLILKNTRC
jgi:hypothetical protein